MRDTILYVLLLLLQLPRAAVADNIISETMLVKTGNRGACNWWAFAVYYCNSTETLTNRSRHRNTIVPTTNPPTDKTVVVLRKIITVIRRQGRLWYGERVKYIICSPLTAFMLPQSVAATCWYITAVATKFAVTIQYRRNYVVILKYAHIIIYRQSNRLQTNAYEQY